MDDPRKKWCEEQTRLAKQDAEEQKQFDRDVIRGTIALFFTAFVIVPVAVTALVRFLTEGTR